MNHEVPLILVASSVLARVKALVMNEPTVYFFHNFLFRSYHTYNVSANQGGVQNRNVDVFVNYSSKLSKTRLTESLIQGYDIGTICVEIISAKNAPGACTQRHDRGIHNII